MADKPNPLMVNAQQRNIVLGASQKMNQQIFAQTVDPSVTSVLNIAPRYAGLIMGFMVEVEAGVTNGASDQADRTGFGSANLVKQFTFTDLNNINRIQTTGYHIALLNSARAGHLFGGAYAGNLPMGYGNNWSPFSGPASLAADAAGTVKHTYWVPMAYGPQDTRGAIYASVVNATMNLQIQLNTTPFVGATDPLNAIYDGNANGDYTDNVSVKVWQIYLDQIPMNGGVPVLPLMDLNTIYSINDTSVQGFSVNQDYPIPYANYRQFLSTMAVFDNGGSYNSGSDVDYFALRSANASEIFKVTPDIAALLARPYFMGDPPPGVYYFDHREKPLDTITYGNLELNLNPLTVNANAQAIMLYEAFRQVNQIPISSSLPGGAQ